MNSRDPSFDRQRLHALASSVIDGNADGNQLRELTKILREHPSARDEYLKLVDLHATLATDISAAPTPQQPKVAKFNEENPLAPSRRRWIPLAAAALAACLLMAFIWFRDDDSATQLNSFATVAQATEVVWDSNSFAIGSRIGAATLRLNSGLVRLEFDSGVEVTLEGPAEFRLADMAYTELKSGLLTAMVPPGAEGFTVDTPSAQVIDLGTSFGVDVGNDGFSNVSVFDGEVEVAPLNATGRNAPNKQLLTEGESVRIGLDYQLEDVRFDPKPFERMSPFASGIASSSETISFVPPWIRRIRFVQSDDQIFVRPEGHAVRLDSALDVNLSEPGEYVTSDDLSASLIQAKTRVRSYILHYSPESQLGLRKTGRIQGTITFDRPVLGIIVLHDELLASSRRFGRHSAGEIHSRRELNLSGDDAGDRITLSENRKTVTLDWISPGRSSDLVRVIVDSRGGFRPPPRRKRN